MGEDLDDNESFSVKGTHNPAAQEFKPEGWYCGVGLALLPKYGVVM
jgi:hypothetical protein